MDKLKDLANKAKEMKGPSSNTTTSNNAGGAGQEDYADKGLDTLEKKAGFSQSRETNEKLTDQGRTMFEKSTGKHLPSKFSN